MTTKQAESPQTSPSGVSRFRLKPQLAAANAAPLHEKAAALLDLDPETSSSEQAGAIESGRTGTQAQPSPSEQPSSQETPRKLADPLSVRARLEQANQAPRFGEEGSRFLSDSALMGAGVTAAPEIVAHQIPAGTPDQPPAPSQTR